MPQNRIAVLVVEDEPLLRFSIVQNLEDDGFIVFEAANSTEALVVLSINPEIHALFTDIDMPGDVDGLKLAAFVRDRWPPIKIVITSGKHPSADVLLPVGGRFIPKPYSPAHVIASLRELVAAN